MKLRTILAIVGLMVALALPGFATSVASIKGTYSFQFSGVTNQYGYYCGAGQSGNCPWHNLNGAACPKDVQCGNVAFAQVTVGTISFDGAGHATFLSIANYNQEGGGNAPKKGTVWPYSVSGNNAFLGSAGDGASLSLGSFNSAGVATVLQMFIAQTNPAIGTAILQ